MNLSHVCAIFACGVAFSAPPAAAGYLTSNGLVVEPQGAAFFIPYRGQSGARSFWCAAGEYAQKKLGQPPATVVYRTSEPPRRSGEGVGFSLSPTQSASSTGLLSFGAKGGGITIASARNLCDGDMLLFR